jgi:O-antigen/teichoic acid export membrane protein
MGEALTALGHEHSGLQNPLPPQVLDGSGRQLARGSLTVASGLTITGCATLGMLTLVDHRLPGDAKSAFNVWWVMTTLLSATFGVFEAYLSRLAVAENAAGRNPEHVVGVLLGRCWLVAAGMGAVVLALGPWLTSREFKGYVSLTLLLPVFVFLAATQSVQRAAATGRGRFPAIAAQLSTDGLLRIGICSALFLSGHASVLLLAIGTCVAATGGLLAGGLACPRWFARPRLRGADISWRPVLLLLAGAAGPLLASSGPVPWLQAAGHASDDTIAVFSAAVTVSRIPTQFVAAAFGPLLSQLARAIEMADHATFARLRQKAEVTAAILGALFVVVFAVGGIWALPLYAPTAAGSSLDLGILAMLAGAGALMFFAVVQQASLAALDRWGGIALAWVIGTVALCLSLLTPASALDRASFAPVAAIATACVVMLLIQRVAARRVAAADGADGASA